MMQKLHDPPLREQLSMVSRAVRTNGMTQRRKIGVLGGMGPLATVDFMQKVIAATPATCDQDHVPMLVYSVPQIPDRVSAIAAGTDEPFPAILAGLRVLESAGADLIVMPCNTAHAWYDRLAASASIDLMHIADAVKQRAGDSGEALALLATRGTIRAGFYQRYLITSQRQVIIPSQDIQSLIDAAIAAVKVNRIDEAATHFSEAAGALIDVGADRLLLACTELPLAAARSTFEPRCLDATVCLAEAAVQFSMARSTELDVTHSSAARQEAQSWTSVGSKIS
jgi:aspartate racemase